MKAISDRQVSPAHESLPKVFDATTTLLHIRRLIWLYLLLLIFEGVFRKWIVPQLSAPLLVVRDPVVVAIYVLALRARLFPQNIYIVSLEIIALLSWATGIIVLLPLYSIRTAILRDRVRGSLGFSPSPAHLHHSRRPSTLKTSNGWADGPSSG